jgi:hypothetical protein
MRPGTACVGLTKFPWSLAPLSQNISPAVTRSSRPKRHARPWSLSGFGQYEKAAGCPRQHEAVGIFAGSDDFLCINDKEPVLHQVILVSEAPLRPPEALLRGRPKTPLSPSYNRSEFSDSLVANHL